MGRRAGGGGGAGNGAGTGGGGVLMTWIQHILYPCLDFLVFTHETESEAVVSQAD